MPQEGKLAAWLRTENKLSCCVSQNTHVQPGTRKLYGGTFSCAFGEAASYVSKSGEDTSGLGRWSWHLCTGKDGVTTVITFRQMPGAALTWDRWGEGKDTRPYNWEHATKMTLEELGDFRRRSVLLPAELGMLVKVAAHGHDLVVERVVDRAIGHGYLSTRGLRRRGRHRPPE